MNTTQTIEPPSPSQPENKGHGFFFWVAVIVVALITAPIVIPVVGAAIIGAFAVVGG